MTNYDLTSKKLNRYELFVLVSITGTISFFVCALLAGANAFDWLIMNNNGRFEFGDYFQHVLFMHDAKHVYLNIQGVWGTFPPLSYLFYYLLFRFTQRNGSVYSVRNAYMNSEYTLLIFLFYVIFLTLAFLYAKVFSDIEFKEIRRSSVHKSRFLCLLLSTPFFAGAYERGNSALIVTVLLLLALNWRYSNSKVKRELAMVLIAVCAGFKVYPAIFGLLYLKEKRWKEYQAEALFEEQKALDEIGLQLYMRHA